MKRYCTARSRFARIIIVLTLIASVSIVFVPSAMAALNPPSIDWTRTFSGLQANSVIQTSDGGYAIAGMATSSGASTLIKTDSSGNTQWQKAIGDAVSLAQTSDSGYLLFLENGIVVKTDSEGNTLSSFSAGLTGVRQGIVTTEGSYILVGNTIGDDGEAYGWLRKVDPQGTIVWDKKFTGGFEISAVVETVDRGCAVAGNWKTDFWLAKIDSNGNQQWSQTYSYGQITDTHFVYAMAKTKDGGFILAGTGFWQSSDGMVPWLVKINSEGHEQWNLAYGQYAQDSFSAIVQTSDEGYLVAQPGAAALIRTDSSGSELWKVSLGVTGGWTQQGLLTQQGLSIVTTSNNPSSCLIRTKDGGYAIAGATFGNAFLIKIASEANLQAPVVTITSPKSKTYETNEVPLTFTVNGEASWLGYSLDGQQAVTITGNTTITGLAVGAHNITVSARSATGLVGTSGIVTFTVAARFPTEWVLVGVGIAIAASVSFLLYVKRRSLSEYKKRGLRSFVGKQSLVKIVNNRIAWTLIIIGLCFVLVFVQVFFPYVYYSSSSRNSNSHFEVGVSYVYEQDSASQIYNEVSSINDLGFSVIRVNLVCDSTNPGNYLNTLSEVFFSAVRQVDIKVALIINNHASSSDINYYLDRWGSDLAYVQILNEPDVASSWDMGALFTDDEAGAKFDEIYTIVEQHQLSAQFYTNFSPAFVVRTNLPVQFSEKLDFVGYDVFMDSFLTISPPMIQLLQKISHKDVVIAEYGMSSSDDQAQSDYIIKGLNLFRNMNLKGCWIVYWNSVNNYYGIRGRLAEQRVGEWIAENS